jgi:hypothetical protein
MNQKKDKKIIHKQSTKGQLKYFKTKRSIVIQDLKSRY